MPTNPFEKPKDNRSSAEKKKASRGSYNGQKNTSDGFLYGTL